MRQTAIFFIQIFLSSLTVFSQAVVEGKIADNQTGKPIEFATLSLQPASGADVIYSTATDSTGFFSFENISPGDWFLKCSFIGYEIKDTSILVSQEEKKINIGKIILSSSATQMEEVVISAEGKKQAEFSIDKKIYNVDKDVSAASGSASDVLKNIPSVQVDIDGNVSLRGSGNVLILVNGKPSPMLGKNAAEALQNFPASSIERIEVITNPSAKYKPDGTGGIINIVLKKNTKPGMNASLSLNAGNNDRYNGNISFSYKPGKMNIYGNFGLRQNTHIRTSTIERTNFDSTGVAEEFYQETNTAPGKSFSQSGIFGIDYEINGRNTVSLSSNYFHFKVDRENVSLRKIYDENNVLQSDYTRTSLLKPEETEIENTFSWEHKFKKEDHELSFECVGVIQDEHENSHYSNLHAQPNYSSTFDNVFLDKKDNPLEVVLDYSNPLTEDGTLEAGYERTFNNIEMDYRGEYLDSASGEFVKDNSTSYHFLYKDMRNAVYATWEEGIEDFGFLVGLRAEQVNLEGKVTNIDSAFANDYFNLYPSAHLKYEFGNAELGLSYSRRVNRPDGDELNPFPEYDDPRNIFAGNPKLLPEYIHSLELGCEMNGKKISFIPSVYYRYTYNAFTQVTVPLNDSTLLTTQQNLSSDQAAGLEFIFAGKVTSWLTGNISSNIFYNQIDASNLGYSKNKSTFSAVASLNANISAGKQTMFQLNGSYHSEELTPQGKYLPMFTVNAGAKQEFFSNKLAVVFTANDIFKSMKHQSMLDSKEFSQVNVSMRNSRIFFLGIKYRLGSLTKKQKEEALQFDNSEK